MPVFLAFQGGMLMRPLGIAQLDALPSVILGRVAQIGLATEVLWRSDLVQVQAWAFSSFVLPGIQLDQISYSFDDGNNPDALMTWAFLSDEVAAELAENPWRPLHLSEWNEGGNLWVMALLGARAAPVALLRRTLRERLSAYPRVRGYRRASDGRATRLVERTLRPCVAENA